jgi:ppGpp synthetase/RelA/SpoT-type nucleotidyltranferase
MSKRATNWVAPALSRNQVDKAGVLLVDPHSSEGQLEWAFTVVNNWRASHSYPLLNFKINLRTKLKSIQPSALVAQRIKRLQSIKVKLERSPTMQLSQMQDIGGCRAVVKSIQHVGHLVSSYKKSRFAHIFRGEKNYIESPKADGYRSHHLVQFKTAPKSGIRQTAD